MKSPVDDGNTNEWSAPVPLECGDSAPLLTPSRLQSVDEQCVAAALPTNRRSIRALTVSVHDSIDTVLKWWQRMGDIICAETAVITVGDRTRSGTAAGTVGEITSLSPNIKTMSVTDAGDFTGLGIAITSCLDAWADSDEPIVLYFDSLTPSGTTHTTMSEHPPDEETKKSDAGVRDEYPTGWLVLTRNESVAYIVDALLDLSPMREFNQSELARMAEVSRQSVNRHLDLLIGIGIIEPVDDTKPQRYRFNPESPVSEALIQLDGAMNQAGQALEA